MKIIDRATFLAMPAETLFAKYEPCCFGDLTIKLETTAHGNDFYEQDLIPWFLGTNDSGQWFDTLERVQAGEQSPPLDFDFSGRDGLYDEDQLFAVFEYNDVVALIERLQRCVSW